MELEIQGQKFRFRNPELTEARIAEVKALAVRLLRQAEERAPQLAAAAASSHHGVASAGGGPPPSTQLALLALVELAAEYIASRDRVASYQDELRQSLLSPSA